MHKRTEKTNQPESKADSNNPFSIYSQPWWRGLGNDSISPDVLGESSPNLASAEHRNGGEGAIAIKSPAKGVVTDDGNDPEKEMKITLASQSGTSIILLFFFIKGTSIVLLVQRCAILDCFCCYGMIRGL